MPKLKAGHISPTHDENAGINAGIAADPDARELDAKWFEKGVEPQTAEISVSRRSNYPASCLIRSASR
jgi:hypothetical protein